ncbi:MAG: GAF domain-containing sensor histidine kinase [Balneolaceae bacterium]|nr:GAF domain-containing sensor histidine kinase [Balneolaceae bacterium]MCH8548047.1 GAF domain-containing sensor histidine kinase [Balneolaceae bacterium]
MRNDEIDINAEEKARLKALYNFSILDTEPEEEFDDLTRLAAEICDVPISEINLIDKNRQWTKSAYGTDSANKEVARDQTVCQYTVRGNDLLEITNLSKDNRFAGMPFVTGEPGYMYYLGAPLISDNGQKVGALCVLDKQERKLTDMQKRQLKILAGEVIARLELKKKNKELEELNSHKVELMKMLSHDMRSPINGIIGVGSLLRETLEVGETAEMVALMEQSAIQLNQMIDEILSYSLIETGGYTVEKETFDLNEVIKSVGNLYRPVAKSKGVELTTVCSLAEPVSMDRGKFEQITGNLLSNAPKFTRKGGRVDLKVERVTEKNEVVLTVKDSGIGMTEDQKKSLFQNEKVGSKQGTSGEKSTGLGLSIIKHFIDLQGGFVDVKSEQVKGTQFTLYFRLRSYYLWHIHIN